jgi:hypothetical protein
MFPSSWLVPFSRFFPLFLLSNRLQSSVTGGVRGINSCCALVTYELLNNKNLLKIIHKFVSSYGHNAGEQEPFIKRQKVS